MGLKVSQLKGLRSCGSGLGDFGTYSQKKHLDKDGPRETEEDEEEQSKE